MTTHQLITQGDVLSGRYRIDGELGAGAMGVVYAAWHLELDQPVALKIVSPPANDLTATTVRFRREVRAAAKIRSEHVARVLDVGTLESGLPYMVMEMLRGNDLESELTRRGRLPVAEAVEYVLQAIEAVAEAHAAGIVHRDLKPANLFLARRPDETRIIKVLDFGISKSILGDSPSTQVSLTQTGMMMGSPLYMSPEQMQSARDTDARCDIWALGVVLYQLLTGTLPFQGNSILELCAAVLREVPPPVSRFRSDVPVGCEQAMRRCLERERDRRFQNVAELALALVDFARPEARVHCERAQRVLFPEAVPYEDAPPTRHSGHSGSDVEGEGEGRFVASPLPSLPGQKSSDPGTPGSLMQSPAPVEPHPSAAVTPATQAAWDSSRRPRAHRRNLRLGTIALALLAVGAAVVVRHRFHEANTVQHAATPVATASAMGIPVHSAAHPARALEPAGAQASPIIDPLDTVVTQSEVRASTGASQTASPAPATQKTTGGPTSNHALRSTSGPERAREHRTRENPAARTNPTTAKASGTLAEVPSVPLPDYGGRR